MNYKEIFESFTQKIISDKKGISREDKRNDITLSSLGYKEDMTSEEAFEFSINYCRSKGLNPIKGYEGTIFDTLLKNDNNIIIRHCNSMSIYEIIKRVPIDLACEVLTKMKYDDNDRNITDAVMGIICINIRELENTFEIESKEEFLKLYNVDKNIIDDNMDLKYLPQILNILIDPTKYKK